MNGVLEKIYEAGLKFLVPLGLEDTYTTITQEAIKLVGADSGSIFLSQQGELKRVYASDPTFYKIIPRPNGYIYRVFKTGKPCVLNANQIERIHPEIKDTDTETNSNLMVPLSYRGRPVGVLTLQSPRNGHFDDEHLNILTLFSALASLAIRKTQMYDEIKQALDTRDDFISMASHELRTPLTAVNGYIQLLNTRVHEDRNPEYRWLQELTRECYRLTELVKELLEINRIKSGQLHYEWREQHLRDVIYQSVRSFNFSYPDRIAEIKDLLGEESDIFVGDIGKMVQVFSNILENAAKYSDPNSIIVVSLSFKFPFLIIKVKDQGKGIKKEDLSKVFDNYYRGTNHQREGIGLGLYLAKDIIDRHHGSIKVHSKPNKGTEVEIRLLRSKK